MKLWPPYVRSKMSTEPSDGCQAPSVALRVDGALAQYVVPTTASVVWRIHSLNEKTGRTFAPVYFSRKEGSRWDFKSNSKHPYSDGVLCLGKTFEAAMIETFAKKWPSVLAPTRPDAKPYETGRVLTPDDCTRKSATPLHLPAGLRLFDLTAPAAMNSVGYGLDAWLTATKAYHFTRSWSRWFFQCSDIDGLIYSSRPGGAQMTNYVLFSRPGLKGKLRAEAGQTRQLGQWRSLLRNASVVLNFTILAPLPKVAADE